VRQDAEPSFLLRTSK